MGCHPKPTSTKPLAALLAYNSGLRIDLLKAKGLSTVDEDLLVGQLDVIMTFLRSPETLSDGRWMSQMTTDEMTIVIERGTQCYLVVIIRGPIPQDLRSGMQSALGEFEALNGNVLANWSGLMSEVRGCREALQRIMEWKAQAMWHRRNQI